jgi:NodT family efflux transporter outer membrane factor (OMF) lipoprotein
MQTFNPAAAIPFDWWTLFQSPALNSLIAKSFKANPDIASAGSALKQAQEYANAQHGFFYPTIGISDTASRSKVAGNLASASAPGVQGNGDVLQSAVNKPLLYNFHTAQVMVDYAPDVFGLNRRQMEAAGAVVEMQNLQLEAAYVSLASNVVAAAVQEATLRAQITAQERIVSTCEEQMNILQKQFAAGYVSALEVAAQQTVLAQARQALIPLRNQLEQTRNLLRALAGQYPDHELEETFHLADLHLPQELPLSLPSTLVEQRPDIRAAEEQLHLASAEAGVAVANRLPQFDISAALGGAADAPGWMLRSGGGFFDLAASVSQVIFDGGTLRAKSRAAQDALEQAGAQYRGTVIHALQDVADTLHNIQSDAELLQASTLSLQASEQAWVIARKQYQAGDISYPVQLMAEQTYQTALINQLQAQANRFTDTASLYQALGGGWWNRNTQDITSNTVSNKTP